MRNRSAALNIFLLAALSMAFVAVPASFGQDEQEVATETEDVLYMKDGRILHGQILEERPTEILFKYEQNKISATVNIPLNQIAKIERDNPRAGAAKPADEEAEETASDTSSGSSGSGAALDEDVVKTYGAYRASVDDPNVPSFYLVPMKGQMGTDVHPDAYRKVIEEIRQHDPDHVVIILECQDDEDRLYSRIAETEKSFHDSNFLDMYRDLVGIFREELRDYPQSVWVHDSQGVSSVIALSWPDLYMTPNARLGGTAAVAQNFAVQDAEVLAKFREAYMAWLKGFAEYGRYPLEIVDAMVRQEVKLSASWEGRVVDWRTDTEGQYIVDDSDKHNVNFRSKSAEDLCISAGTAETLDDLALLLGFREYRVIDGEAEEIVQDYKDDWRGAFDRCGDYYREYEKFMGWASGEDTLRYLGKSKNMLENILHEMDRYEAVEVRLLTDRGMRRLDLVVLIEQLKEQIASMRGGQRGGGGTRGGGTGPGGG